METNPSSHSLRGKSEYPQLSDDNEDQQPSFQLYKRTREGLTVQEDPSFGQRRLKSYMRGEMRDDKDRERNFMGRLYSGRYNQPDIERYASFPSYHTANYYQTRDQANEFVLIQSLGGFHGFTVD